ncbi:MAG: GH3 auxin-responsive promoter family protein [Oscillospiraceae bacterium]|nr:GH3 auxin-responsive promoter family protein [Oscillospiraceae bacterium]
MKTDYAALGKQALNRLRLTCENADEVQHEMLFELLYKNQDAEFGREYHFSDIKSIADFQGRIPISDYNDYSDYIFRIINGGENILTVENPVYFCISSGTTGMEKYLPLHETDIMLQYLYTYGTVFGTVREYYKEISDEELFGKIFQIGEFAKTHMPDGRMSGIRSGCVYQWLDRDDGFDASDYCVPKEILFPDTLEDLLYTKVRFALAERDLTAIHGVFVNRVAGVMEYILHNWELLLNDMEYGSVSTDIGEEQKKYLVEKLPPDPRRAKELRSISCENLHAGMIKKIWKKIKYILTIGGASFSYYTQKILEYADGIPIHHYAYAASEGVFGISEKMDVPDRYILFPEAGFFEFLPINAKTKIPILLCEIEIGKKYEIIFTNHSGLYRYRLGDVIEVVGKFKKAPVVKYCYRQNQVLSIAGEKTNREQLAATIKRFSEMTGADIAGYCVCEDHSNLLPRYLFYIECVNYDAIENAREILEECMRNANFDYRSCESMNEIAGLKLSFLQRGSFREYEQRLAESGRFMGQSKLLHFLDTEEKKKFFADQTIKGDEL